MEALPAIRASESDYTDEEIAPFIRFDSYGRWGLEPQPLSERLRLTLMSLTIFPLRILSTVILFIIFYSVSRLAQLLPHKLGDQVYCYSGKKLTALCLYLVGFRIKWVRAENKPEGPKAAFAICNHVSWSDIVIHMSDRMPSFVARDGTQDLPLIGFFSQKLRCLYVKRAKDEAAASAQGAGVSSLIKKRQEEKAQDPSAKQLLLFPEGTTSNGRYLLPFKTGSFLSGLPVQPYIIKYSEERRLYASWDTIEFQRQFWLLFCQPTTPVTIYELPVYVPSEEEKKDPALYASRVRDYMLKFGNLKPSSSTFPLKMGYMKVSSPNKK